MEGTHLKGGRLIEVLLYFRQHKKSFFPVRNASFFPSRSVYIKRESQYADKK